MEDYAPDNTFVLVDGELELASRLNASNCNCTLLFNEVERCSGYVDPVFDAPCSLATLRAVSGNSSSNDTCWRLCNEEAPPDQYLLPPVPGEVIEYENGVASIDLVKLWISNLTLLTPLTSNWTTQCIAQFYFNLSRMHSSADWTR